LDEDIADGNQVFQIVTQPALSSDNDYNGLDPDNVEVTNIDDDSAGINVQPAGPMLTTEAGGSAGFTVALFSEPTSDVNIAISSGDPSEGEVSPVNLTFTPVNWAAPQTVTVTGVDDSIADGNQVFMVLTAPAVSSDTAYSGLDADDVSVTNLDNDSAGILISPVSGLTTTESGGSDTFSVVLNSQPMANVSLGVSSDDESEGLPTPVSLVFTPVNWNAPQLVNVSGVEDDVQDGNQVFHVVTSAATSSDPGYSGMNASDVEVQNIDNDSAGITVSPTSGLVTSESGGTDTFTLVLNSQPVGDVSLVLASGNPNEGSVDPTTVVFSPLNWNAPKTITVTGVDDSSIDGNQVFSVVTAPVTSSDANYNGMNPADVTVTNNDNDSAGITVSPVSGLITSESGGTATFSVVLNSMPTDDVSLGLSSSNLAEGTVDPLALIFTQANWNAPQTVTVTGVDDAVADGNQPYTIVTSTATSSDLNYNGLLVDDVLVSNTDNDSAGVSVFPTSGLTTTEDGGQANFSIVLNSQPTADVSMDLSVSDSSEATLSTSSLTFTNINWDAPQTVTITGLDDAIADGNQSYTVVTAPVLSGDGTYQGMDAADVSVTNTDNDSAGVSVSPVSGLNTSEAGGTDTFRVVLNSEPTADVTIALSSSDLSEGTVSPAGLTFTSSNWNAPRNVIVTGVDDAGADGNQVYTINTAAVVSADTGYNGINPDDVSVSNTDNDSAGVTVNPTAGLTTTESGGGESFSVVLNSQPTADVVIGMSVSDSSEGSVNPSSLTFTSVNWNAPQNVSVTGVDDTIIDGNQVFNVVSAPVVSSDTNYSSLNPDDVSVTNMDNDSAGVTVSPVAGLTTSESGGSASFSMVLISQPMADVQIALSSSDVSEGTVNPAGVTFTASNWNAPQQILVSGVDDLVSDGNQVYSIITAPAVSADADYSGHDAADVSCSNVDDDSASITVTPTAGLVTTEAGGTAQFFVFLNSEPTANVAIGLSSSNVTEGTVSPANLTFTSSNWSAPQAVNVVGQDDLIADGNQVYSVMTAAAVSTDPGYNGIDAADVSLSNTDNDTAGILVTPVAGLVTTEGAGSATFTVVLNSEPTSDVTIDLSSSDATEGTVSPVFVTFTSLNWNAPQTVTVTGVDDAVADGNQVYTIQTAPAMSLDANYAGLDADDAGVSNTDNDSAGVTVSQLAGLITTETGGVDTFTVVLNSEPTENVTIDLSSSDLTEGEVGPASLVFTAMNWNAPQTVTVMGVDDAVQDGNQVYSINTSEAISADINYNGLNVDDVSVSNTDNDSAGFTITPLSGLTTTEAGGSDSFDIVLNSEPTFDVSISLASSDSSEGTVVSGSLVFTAMNWNAPQTVTVTGVDDAVQDGNQVYSILLGAAVSSDANYAGLDPDDVSVSNTDNDSAGISVTPLSGLVTTEALGTATFSVVLNSQPVADVSMGLSSSDLTEGTISPNAITFTDTNWNAPQTITVTGVDDAVADGNQVYTILISPAASTDTNYNGLDASDVSVSNTDNDSAGITVAPVSGLVTTEALGTDTFTVVLNSQPTADVILVLSSSDTSEGTVNPTSLTFTDLNWNAPQTVTVSGVDDAVADGNQVYTIQTVAATSADANYSGMNPDDVSVTNTDNDSAGFAVTPVSGLVTTEAGGQAGFTVALNSQPTADVILALSSSDTSEGTVHPTSLTFTSINWNAPQTVTVTGVDDAGADGNQPYVIQTAAATSGDSNYNGMNPEDVSASNTDNDSAGITVDPVSGLVTTEAGGIATFTVVLNSQPTANVSIGLSSGDTGEGTLSPTTLVFTDTNWNAPQTVTVTGVDDAIADGNQPYTIQTAAATSADAGYDGMNAEDVSVSNTDNDSAGFTVDPTSGLVSTESGGTGTFTVVLNSEPTADVVMGLSSGDTSEGTVSPGSLTFTSLNWNAPQTVTVTGVDDAIADGNQPYTIQTAAATSADANYNGMNAEDVSVSNTDNDSAGVTVDPTGGLNTSESGGVDTFTVVLNSQPIADVTILLSSSDISEGNATPTSLVFTSTNWNAPQTVTATGVDDAIADGNQPYTIQTGAATSSDADYNGLNPDDVSVTNVDNDSAGISVTPVSGLETSETGTTDSFAIVLNSQPTSDVTINLLCTDTGEGTLSLLSVVFTASDWNTPQEVVLTGVDDTIVDGDQPYSVITSAAVSSDSGYNGLNPPNVQATNLDDGEGRSRLGAPSVSSDGQLIAFATDLSDLVENDTNELSDVFVYDSQSDSIERISLAFDGQEANGDSLQASISGDGRYVAFSSFANNLVGQDINAKQDVFVFDRQTGQTVRISRGGLNEETDGDSRAPAISFDGHVVAFDSDASNLVDPGGDKQRNVYVFDFSDGTMQRASSGAESLGGSSQDPSLSADGRFVAFGSTASLVPGDDNSAQDIYVNDRLWGTTVCASVDSTGRQANNRSDSARISADGKKVVFLSTASNLVPDDTNGVQDVFVHILDTGETLRSSVSSQGIQADGLSLAVTISANGEIIGFSSRAKNLVPNDTNGKADVFVFDLKNLGTRRVSLDLTGQQSLFGSHHPSLSAQGNVLIFITSKKASFSQGIRPELMVIDLEQKR
jgi:hypothetical protein